MVKTLACACALMDVCVLCVVVCCVCVCCCVLCHVLLCCACCVLCHVLLCCVCLYLPAQAEGLPPIAMEAVRAAAEATGIAQKGNTSAVPELGLSPRNSKSGRQRTQNTWGWYLEFESRVAQAGWPGATTSGIASVVLCGACCANTSR